MVDRIAAGVGRLGRGPFVAHPEIVRRPPHQHRGTGQADDTRGRKGGVCLQHGSGVALGIDGDEDGLDLIRPGSEFAETAAISARVVGQMSGHAV